MMMDMWDPLGYAEQGRAHSRRSAPYSQMCFVIVLEEFAWSA